MLKFWNWSDVLSLLAGQAAIFDHALVRFAAAALARAPDRKHRRHQTTAAIRLWSAR